MQIIVRKKEMLLSVTDNIDISSDDSDRENEETSNEENSNEEKLIEEN